MYKYLLDIIKKVEGNVVGIGLESILLDGFNKNNKVNVYTIDRAKPGLGIGKRKKRKTSSGRTINIKKLYKYFKKKNIDYIFCDVEEINDYLKYFIRDSIYLNRSKLYLYGKKDEIDIELFEKRFKRYHSNIEIREFKDSILLIIDNSKAKSNWFKNKWFYFSDTMYNLVDFISNVLTS